MAAMIINIQPGDEVVFPSYTFVSTVNAFVARGAKPVFVDIEKNTMNLNVNLVEGAITERTRAIVPVHYAGIVCDMDGLMDIASRHHLVVVEDAAHSLTSKYRGTCSATIGHIGCISFHETKNITPGGQGGAVLVNRSELVDRAEVVSDNGTNRVQFLRGELPMYEWQDVGSNHIMSEFLLPFCGPISRWRMPFSRPDSEFGTDTKPHSIRSRTLMDGSTCQSYLRTASITDTFST
ncbi:hypothetical protein CSUB01_12343 [Colletotrichum sublineola]|uniref:TDP-4-keto-6-deoxy-D-glucose transaminase n=1 Tax=Colletotrichum sublineola TaxID=1173701 RepID=A0A066XUJ8_COLSU|nr:hypothetical protein CSUB01_12343 [Colletotrichum sublineola]